MFTTTTTAERPTTPVRTTARARRAAQASLLTVRTTTVHVLDGGAPRGALSGRARHVLEQVGRLTSAQRLDLCVPAALPRSYTPAQALRLADALTAAGATVALSGASTAG